MNSLRYSVTFTLSLLLFAGCSAEEPKQPAAPKTNDAAARLVLQSDPGDAIGVVEAKENGQADGVIVEGRVHDMVKGFAVVKIMDTELKYCGEVHAEDCETPWDYCCDSPDRRKDNSLLVEFRDAAGKPIATPAMPNTRHCDLVKVRGKMTVDEHGSHVLVADGIFQVERPELPEFVKWPQ